MIARCLGQGCRFASKRPALVSLLWAINLALGLLATVPAWTWWRHGFGPAPAADALLDGFNLATFFDLVHYDRSAVFGLLGANVVALVVAASVVGSLAFGGTLEILRATDGRTFMHRFFRGAGHFFSRFLRLAVYTAVAAVIVVGLVAAALAPLLSPLDESAWEPGWVTAILVRIAVVGAVLVYFLLVLDYARIRVAIGDTRRLFVTWIASLGFVLRHLFGAYGIALAFGALAGVLLALYLGYCSIAPIRTSGLILVLVIVQQAVMWLRTGARVAQVAAEIQFHSGSTAALHAAASTVLAPPDSPAVAGPSDPQPPAPESAGQERAAQIADSPRPQ